jgi:hypothetical protein
MRIRILIHEFFRQQLRAKYQYKESFRYLFLSKINPFEHQESILFFVVEDTFTICMLLYAYNYQEEKHTGLFSFFSELSALSLCPLVLSSSALKRE